MATRGAKMASGVWKVVYPKVFGRFRQLSQNKIFDLSTPSMRKVDNGGETGKNVEEIMTEILATNVVASRRPECRPTAMPTTRANS